MTSAAKFYQKKCRFKQIWKHNIGKSRKIFRGVTWKFCCTTFFHGRWRPGGQISCFRRMIILARGFLPRGILALICARNPPVRIPRAENKSPFLIQGAFPRFRHIEYFHVEFWHIQVAKFSILPLSVILGTSCARIPRARIPCARIPRAEIPCVKIPCINLTPPPPLININLHFLNAYMYQSISQRPQVP